MSPKSDNLNPSAGLAGVQFVVDGSLSSERSAELLSTTTDNITPI